MIRTILPITCHGREVSLIIININIITILNLNIDDGMNIDNWTLDEIIQMVQDYYVYCTGDQADTG
jgi:hypothetical protein